ncbi:hypothetical protein [Nocardia sp. NPDC049526]|uniref:hypothetical protein n=1 Tax=Nocardia sp. NPDC049526 TaxID=3364316 RepID=UPI0037975EFB
MHDDVDYTKLATPAEKKKYAKQNSLMYGGLIAIGVVILQGFLTASPLGVSGRISMIAFAISLPLLAVLLMLDEWQSGEQAPSPSMTDDAAKAIALLSSLVGVVAAFWHIDWSAGVAVIAAGVVALGVYGTHFSSTSFTQAVLRRNQQRSAAPQAAPVTTAQQPPASQPTTPQPPASQPAAPQPPTAQSTAPRSTANQPEATRTATPEPTTPAPAAPGPATPESTAPQPTKPTAPESTTPASAASKQATRESTAPQPTTAESAVPEPRSEPTTIIEQPKPPQSAPPSSDSPEEAPPQHPPTS